MKEMDTTRHWGRFPHSLVVTWNIQQINLVSDFLTRECAHAQRTSYRNVGEMSLARSIGHSLSCKLSLMRNAVNFQQIWRILTASLTFSLPLAKIHVCWSSKLKEIA